MKRLRFVVVAAVVTVAALGTFKFRQVQAAIAQGASFTPPPEAITTLTASREEWPTTLSGIGTVTAVRGVTVGADLPGVVETITFDSGRSVRAGEVLVTLDARQEEAQLAAALAQLELDRLNLERTRGLRAEGILSAAELDRSAAEHAQAQARVGEIRAAIARKTIRAPFAGLLGIRQVDRGQYLSAGDPIVAVQALDPVYVEFALPQQEVARLRAGTEVRVRAAGLPDATGRITALDAVVDEATRNVKVQATLPNAAARLRPGMFVEAEVVLATKTPVVALPASAVNHAPYGDSIFVVEQVKGPKGETYKGVRQAFVKLGPPRGDRIAVLEGVDAGAEVATSGIFKLRNGAAVHVDNSVRPANEAVPHPENN